MPITQIRTMTYNDEEVYARTHVQAVDGLEKSSSTNDGLMSKEDKIKLDQIMTNSNVLENISENTSISIINQSQLLHGNVNVWPNSTQRVNLSKKLSECANGIILVWRLDKSDELYHYQYIPKYHVNHSSAKVTEMIPTNVTSTTIEHCIKVVYVHDTHVVGVAENSIASTKSNKIRLHEILEY